MTENYYIGQIFEEIYPPEVSSWCYENNAKIVEIEPEKREVEEKYTEIDQETGEEVEKTRIVEVVVRRFELVEIPEHIPTKEEISRERELRFEKEADPLRYAYDEALARGEETAEELKQQWLAKKDEIRADLPYPEENK